MKAGCAVVRRTSGLWQCCADASHDNRDDHDPTRSRASQRHPKVPLGAGTERAWGPRSVELPNRTRLRAESGDGRRGAHRAIFLRRDLVFRSKMSDAAARQSGGPTQGEVASRPSRRPSRVRVPFGEQSAARPRRDRGIGQRRRRLRLQRRALRSLHVVGLPFERRLCVQFVFSVRILDRTIHRPNLPHRLLGGGPATRQTLRRAWELGAGALTGGVSCEACAPRPPASSGRGSGRRLRNQSWQRSQPSRPVRHSSFVSVQLRVQTLIASPSGSKVASDRPPGPRR